MKCPVCETLNDSTQKYCNCCGMLLLHKPLVSINDIAFYNQKIVEITSQRSNEFEVDGETLLRYNGLKKKVVIPHNITIIGDHAFTKAPNKDIIEEIVIHSKVKSINSLSTKHSDIPSNNGAFEMCQSLLRVTIEPESILDEIGIYAFYNCINLEAIEGLPKRHVYIGRHAFCGCSKQLIKAIAKHKEYVFEEHWND